jgi:glycosyltransferase involved in cell wall biosynthesis
LLTLKSRPEDEAHLQELRDSGIEVRSFSLPRWRALWNTARALPGSHPIQANYCWHPKLLQEMERLLTSPNGYPPYDILHVEHLRGVQYALYAHKCCSNLPVIWDSVDCISYLFQQATTHSRSFFGQWVTRLELGRTQKLEKALLHQFDRILVTSRSDKQAYEALLPKNTPHTPLQVLPNGVSLDDFYPDENAKRSSRTLVVSGKMSYHANVTMVLNLVEDIMPLVWREHPEVHLQIVGKDPHPKIQALGDDPRIEVTGTVPHVRPYLQKAAIAVAPLAYGAGIQNKVLEAMACATPVVCTSQAVSALEVEPGRHLLVADTPQTFAQSITDLLRDETRRAAIGEAGHAYVERHHRWDSIAALLEGIYQQAQIERIRHT